MIVSTKKPDNKKEKPRFNRRKKDVIQLNRKSITKQNTLYFNIFHTEKHKTSIKKNF
jgi:hypothetical protein